MELQDAIKRRRSIRKFSSKKPDWRDIIEAINSASYAPMAGEIFSLKILLIEDKKIIKEISKWSEQDFIDQTKYVVAFVSNPKIVKNPFPKKGEAYSHQQAGAAIENFLLYLTETGLSTCWIGYFNEKKISSILKIPEGHIIEAIFPIGYASMKLKPKKNHPDIYNFIYFNQWKNSRMKRIEKIESRIPEGY